MNKREEIFSKNEIDSLAELKNKMNLRIYQTFG